VNCFFFDHRPDAVVYPLEEWQIPLCVTQFIHCPLESLVMNIQERLNVFFAAML
jgi:hypothetical protein